MQDRNSNNHTRVCASCVPMLSPANVCIKCPNRRIGTVQLEKCLTAGAASATVATAASALLASRNASSVTLMTVMPGHWAHKCAQSPQSLDHIRHRHRIGIGIGIGRRCVLIRSLRQHFLPRLISAVLGYLKRRLSWLQLLPMTGRSGCGLRDWCLWNSCAWQ